VYPDAEAMLFKPFDDAFNDTSDITFTLVGVNSLKCVKVTLRTFVPIVKVFRSQINET
jgi:hypothetical protein